MMAALQLVSYEGIGENEFHALSGPGAHVDADDADTDNDVLIPPAHPVRSLQGAFEESYYESTQDSDELGIDDYYEYEHDAEMRRRQLLEAECYEDGWVTKWKPRRGSKYHPYLKLIAQIVFGMHLLEQEQAKSNAEVVRILQDHVNDVDTFLERTWEDFEMANKDIEERIRYLKMPMKHTEVFEVMLDEKKFRTELLKGNEKIEKIVDRTTKAMNSALSDIDAGIKSTEELSVYLSGVKRRWPMNNVEIADVLSAMKGNEQGWMVYLRDLQRKAGHLAKNLNVLNAIVVEISKRAAAASRRNKPQRTVSPTKSSPGVVRSKFARESAKRSSPWTNKPLPQEPKAKLNISRPIGAPISTRPEKSGQKPQAPAPQYMQQPPKEADGSPPRPRNAGHGGGTPRATQSEDMRELAAFLRQSGPLRSHPPDKPAEPSLAALPARTASLSKIRGDREAIVIHSPPRKPSRTQSQGGNELLGFHPMKKANPQSRRSASQGAVPLLGRSPSKTTNKRNIAASPKTVAIAPSPQADSRTSTSTAFSRRMSKRLKTLPQSPISSPKIDMSPRPIDSAFSHIAEKDFQTESENAAKSPVELSKPSPTPATPDKRPGSRLGLFPKNTGPLTPSQASVRSNSVQPDFSSPASKAFTASSCDSPRQPTHSSKSSVSMSLRNFFHRKQPSQNVF